MRKEWQFFGVLPRADRALAVAWWAAIVLRGLLPALFAIAMGMLVGAVQRGESLVAPLAVVGAVFVPLQVLPPIHQALGAILGARLAAWLYDRLAFACVRPPGMGHLEDPKLTSDLTMARDFDLGITGPPLFISMDFIASGLVEMIAGLTSAVVLFGYAWWAPWCWPARGSPPTGSCARAACGATGTPRRCARPSAMPSTRIAWRSSRTRPRSCGSSGWRAGSSSASARGGSSSSSSSGGRPGCASGPWP